MVDGDGGVDPTAFAEEGADRAAGSLGSDENDIDVGRNVNFGERLKDRREAVGEVQGLRAGFVKDESDVSTRQGLTFPLVINGFNQGHVSLWAASLSKFMTMVPR